MPPWLATILAIAGGITTLAGAFAAVRKVAPTVRTIVGVFNDFAGEPARPGVEARPGVIESLTNIKAVQAQQSGELTAIKDTQAEQGEELAKVRHELHPNSGLSLRDAVDRLESTLGVNSQGPAVTVNVAAAGS